MKIDIVCVPVFEGCNIKGVDKAPTALIEAGAVEILKKHHKVTILKEVSVTPVDESDIFLGSGGIKYKSQMIEMTETLCEVISKSINEGRFPITFGGDHSLGTGTIAGSSVACNGNISAIWFDAHPDINTPETSPSKNFHGMSFGAAMGFGDSDIVNIGGICASLKTSNAYLIGIRAIDKGEREAITKNKITNFTSKQVNDLGAEVVANNIIAEINKKGTENIHFSIDVDVVTPEDMKAVNVPEPNGIKLTDAIKIIKIIVAHPKVKSIDFVEYNPLLDTDKLSISNCLKMIEAISETLAQR